MRADQTLELPPPVPHFTGREADVRALCEALALPGPALSGRTATDAATGPRGGTVLPPRPGSGPAAVPTGRARTAVVSGVAGVGKSALAVRVAHVMAADFPDGLVHLRLSGRARPLAPGRALTALLQGLGVGMVPDELGSASRLLNTRLADARMLFVLDGAESAAQVRPLLPDAAGCAVIVTSRTPLTGLTGAGHVRLRPLTVTAGATLLRSSGTGGAGELEELASLCGRLPLALRLAAARLSARDAPSVRDLAGLLGVEADRHGRPGRDDTGLRGPLTVAADALAPEPALALRRIGALPLPWYTAAVLARLMDAHEERAALALEGLARAALVEETAPGRFVPHDVVRAFAAELARPPLPAPDRPAAHDADTAADRVLRWRTAQAREAALAILPPGPHRDRRLTGVLGPAPSFPDPDAACAWADRELPTLTALAETRAAAAPGQVLLLIRCLVPHLEQRLLCAELTFLSELAVTTARHLGDPGAEAQARLDLATARHLAGRTGEARVLVAEAEELWRGTRD